MMLSRSDRRSVVLFLVAGLIAFAVDYGVFRLGSAVGATPLAARGVSWWAAVTTTFAINSLVTFRAPAASDRPGRGLRGLRRDRFLPYVATQALGGLISLGTFLALLPLLRPLLSLVVATLAAASCNYLGARAVLVRRATRQGAGGAEG